MDEPQDRPKVGVGVMIFKEGKVLMARRKGSHGAGDYGFPGGHLEMMESFEECAMRETREECGLEIKNIRFLYVANIKRYAPKHYVHVQFTADWASGEPRIMEPDKAEKWEWFALDTLPDGSIFEFCNIAFDAYKTDKNYYPSE